MREVFGLNKHLLNAYYVLDSVVGTLFTSNVISAPQLPHLYNGDGKKSDSSDCY